MRHLTVLLVLLFLAGALPGVAGGRIDYCRYPGNPCADSTASGIRFRPVADVLRLEVGRRSRPWWMDSLLGGAAGFAGAMPAYAGCAALADEGQCRPAPGRLRGRVRCARRLGGRHLAPGALITHAATRPAAGHISEG